MRIAWLGAGPSEGGVGEVAAALIAEMLDRGHEVDCFLAGDPPANPPASISRSLRVFTKGAWWQWGRWYSRSQLVAFASGLIARAVAQRQLTGLLLAQHRRLRYDVVYQFSNIEMFGLQRHLSELPPIIVHPETHIAGELRWFRLEARLRRQCEPRWRSAAIRLVLEIRTRRQRRDLAHAALVVCISESFRSHLITDYGLDAERTVVAPNPVSLDDFALEVHAPREPILLMFVGRVSTRKGIDTLVDLSHRLGDLRGGVRLKIVGGHTLWSDYRPLLRDLDPSIAEVIGRVSSRDVARHLAEADILVQPSTYEPFGLTVAEALASGTPVVITDAVGAGDFVDGQSVLKVPASDPAALERGVRTMIDRVRSDARNIRELARDQAENAFDVHAVVDLIDAALATVVARRRSPPSAPPEGAPTASHVKRRPGGPGHLKARSSRRLER